MRQPLRLPIAAMAGVLVSGAAMLAGCGTRVSLDEPIEGPTWRLVNLAQQPVVPGGDQQREPRLQFDGARVTGSSGCNQLSGSYQRSGSSLKFGPLAATRMACADPVRGALESNFVTALQGTSNYSLLGRQLLLLDATGRTLAVLESSGR